MDDLGLVEFLPTVEELFKIYNEKYFNNYLIDVKLEWSEKMTRCAGICMLKPSREVIIRLSRPLLQLRPFSDTIDTLLHEMIHAYFFVKQGGSIDRDGHGSDFCGYMERINSLEGTHITVYHSFHDEVDHYKKHIWRCNGVCRLRPPYFGWVKRSMNRKPQSADSWWSSHQASCSGIFEKVSENSQASEKSSNVEKTEGKFKGKGRTWSNTQSDIKSVNNVKLTEFFKKKFPEEPPKFNCVNCTNFLADSLKSLNEHLDICLTKSPPKKLIINLAEDDEL